MYRDSATQHAGLGRQAVEAAHAGRAQTPETGQNENGANVPPPSGLIVPPLHQPCVKTVSGCDTCLYWSAIDLGICTQCGSAADCRHCCEHGRAEPEAEVIVEYSL